MLVTRLLILVLPSLVACGRVGFDSLDDAVCPGSPSTCGLATCCPESGPAFGGTPAVPFAESCPPGDAIVGFAGRSGSDLDALQAMCAGLVVDTTSMIGPDAYLGRTQSVSLGTPFGGTGGQPFSEPCPQDHVVIGIHGEASGYIQRFGFTCASMAVIRVDGRWHVQITPSQTSQLYGISTGGSPFGFTCPDGDVVIGLRGGSLSFSLTMVVAQVGVECGVLDLM